MYNGVTIASLSNSRVKHFPNVADDLPYIAQEIIKPCHRENDYISNMETIATCSESRKIIVLK